MGSDPDRPTPTGPRPTWLLKVRAPVTGAAGPVRMGKDSEGVGWAKKSP